MHSLKQLLASNIIICKNIHNNPNKYTYTLIFIAHRDVYMITIDKYRTVQPHTQAFIIFSADLNCAINKYVYIQSLRRNSKAIGVWTCTRQERNTGSASVERSKNNIQNQK